MCSPNVILLLTIFYNKEIGKSKGQINCLKVKIIIYFLVIFKLFYFVSINISSLMPFSI